MEQLGVKEGFKSGFIAVVGQPNVGKSTLINSLIGEKIAITSRKAQTTRNKIQCILTLDGAQLIFIDTPGIHTPQDKMGKYLNKTAYNVLKGIDLVLFVVDVNYPPNAEDKRIASELEKFDSPILLVLNKVDAIKKSDLARRIKEYERLLEPDDLLSISAKQETNLEQLVELMIDFLSEGPQYYPDNMITDQIEQFIIAELIREKILKHTHQEVPHSVAIEVIDFVEREDKGLIEIRVNIYVERSSQKGIIIGKNGKMLKKIGTQARQDIEDLLSTKVFLDLWVKVEKDWRDEDDALKMLGYKK
ncbi:GTPase Era [Natroniella acetigena]|uniref:GTPase Era n=1 Tax=Natroniella acetigena TaxID=52004 RepID=UPI00200AC139|nr:GTPase Era [Natroniella acetigena]MCK8826986.1 GTPase Era [Natroniella acetigena]